MTTTIAEAVLSMQRTLQQLGRLPDKALAAESGRTIRWIVAQREARGIPPFEEAQAAADALAWLMECHEPATTAQVAEGARLGSANNKNALVKRALALLLKREQITNVGSSTRPLWVAL